MIGNGNENGNGNGNGNGNENGNNGGIYLINENNYEIPNNSQVVPALKRGNNVALGNNNVVNNALSLSNDGNIGNIMNTLNNNLVSGNSVNNLPPLKIENELNAIQPIMGVGNAGSLNNNVNLDQLIN